MTDGEERETLLQIAKAITIKAQDITEQVNRGFVPRQKQHASSMASRLRDFMRMNPPMFFGSTVDEDPQWKDSRALGGGPVTWEPLLTDSSQGRKGSLRYEMSHFVTGVSEYLGEECHAAMIHGNMDLSRLMVHAQQVEYSCLRKKNREAKKGRNVDPPKERPTCGKCGKKYVGECLVGTNSCFGSGKVGDMGNDFPNVRSLVKRNGQA
ncbi:uncharacterized protein [Solanum lycopersicum]|uniref:uncharacterized protein n=1 Tax=Solanum lycopersicum TaxID=4081 RepID=UPI00374891AE